MIMTVDELREYLPGLTETDKALELTLKGLEQAVKGATNNDFKRFADPFTGEIVWPDDIKLGTVNLVKWDLDNRDKMGVSSETISRHSVSYAQLTDSESVAGYPAYLFNFVKPYVRARF